MSEPALLLLNQILLQSSHICKWCSAFILIYTAHIYFGRVCCKSYSAFMLIYFPHSPWYGYAVNHIQHLYLYTKFVVVNFDALAQAGDVQIERRQVVFLCWMQDLNQGLWNRISSRLNARWQTDWAIEDQAKTWTLQPVPMISEHSAHSTPLPFGFRTWLWWYTCLLLLISILWHRQAILKSKGDKLSSSAECRIWTRVFGTYIMHTHPAMGML